MGRIGSGVRVSASAVLYVHDTEIELELHVVHRFTLMVCVLCVLGGRLTPCNLNTGLEVTQGH